MICQTRGVPQRPQHLLDAAVSVVDLPGGIQHLADAVQHLQLTVSEYLAEIRQLCLGNNKVTQRFLRTRLWFPTPQAAQQAAQRHRVRTTDGPKQQVTPLLNRQRCVQRLQPKQQRGNNALLAEHHIRRIQGYRHARVQQRAAEWLNHP